MPVSSSIAMAAAAVLLAAVGADLSGPHETPSVTLALDRTGDYTVMVDGWPWLRGAPIVVRVAGKNWSTADKSLELAAVSNATGEDGVGAFSSTTLKWRTAPGVAFETEFRVYGRSSASLAPGAVAFLQRFPDGAGGTAASCTHAESTVFSSFPAFQFDQPPATSRPGPSADASKLHAERFVGAPSAYVQFAGVGVPAGDPDDEGCQMGPWPPNASIDAYSCQAGGALDSEWGAFPNQLDGGWQRSGALAISDDQANRTVVVSPFTDFTTTQQLQVGSVVAYGPRGSIRHVPPGFTSSVIVVPGRGIGRTMRRWGLALMAKHGKDPHMWKEDFSMKHLGYTTDNGASLSCSKTSTKCVICLILFASPHVCTCAHCMHVRRSERIDLTATHET